MNSFPARLNEYGKSQVAFSTRKLACSRESVETHHPPVKIENYVSEKGINGGGARKEQLGPGNEKSRLAFQKKRGGGGGGIQFRSTIHTKGRNDPGTREGQEKQKRPGINPGGNRKMTEFGLREKTSTRSTDAPEQCMKWPNSKRADSDGGKIKERRRLRTLFWEGKKRLLQMEWARGRRGRGADSEYRIA